MAGRTAVRAGPIAAFLRFTRVRDWAHFLPLPWVYATPDTVLSWRFGAAAAVAAGCLGYAYGLNRWLDAELARGAPPDSLEMSRGKAIGVLAALGVGTLILAAFLGDVPVGAAVASLVGGHLYSGWPRLKAVPLLGTLGNAWIFGPLVFLGTQRLDTPPAAPWLAGAFVALLLQNQIVHEAAHRDADARDGIRTTFVRWGMPVGATLQGVFGGIAAGLLAMAGVAAGIAWLGAGAGVAALGLTVAVALSGWTGDVHRAHRVRNHQRWAGLALGALTWAGCLLLAPPG